MTNEKERQKGIKLSRRGFLGSAAIGAAALGGTVVAVSAFSPKLASGATGAGLVGALPAAGSAALPVSKAAPVPVPTNWTMSADVVVVGYGGSGAVTAITAYDTGANVIVVEKTPSIAQLGLTGTTAYYTISGGGGNSHMSMGNTGTPTDPIAAANFLYAASWGKTPMDVCQAWANMAVNNAAW